MLLCFLGEVFEGGTQPELFAGVRRCPRGTCLAYFLFVSYYIFR